MKVPMNEVQPNYKKEPPKIQRNYSFEALRKWLPSRGGNLLLIKSGDSKLVDDCDLNKWM